MPRQHVATVLAIPPSAPTPPQPARRAYDRLATPRVLVYIEAGAVDLIVEPPIDGIRLDPEAALELGDALRQAARILEARTGDRTAVEALVDELPPVGPSMTADSALERRNAGIGRDLLEALRRTHRLSPNLRVTLLALIALDSISGADVRRIADLSGFAPSTTARQLADLERTGYARRLGRSSYTATGAHR